MISHAMKRLEAAGLTSSRAYFAFATALCILLIVFALNDYPLPWSDSEGLCAAVSYAHGDGFLNMTHMTVRRFNPSLHHNYHGYLFQIILGKLLPHDGASHLIPRIITLMAAFVTLVSSIIFFFVFKLRGAVFSWADATLAALSLCAQAAVLMYLSGRAEILSILFTSITIVLLYRFPRCAVITMGVTAGLQAAISPSEGAIWGLLSIAYFGVTGTRGLKSVLFAVISGVISLLIFRLSFYCLYPFPFEEWLYFVRLNGKVSVGDVADPISTFFFNFIAIPNTPALFFCLVFCMYACFAVMLKIKTKTLGYAMSAAAIVLLVVMLLVLGFCSGRNQNFQGSMPIFLCVLIYYFKNIAGLVARGIAFLVTLIPALGFARCVLLFIVYCKDGVSLEHGLQLFEKIKLPDDGIYGGSRAVLFFTDDYKRLRFTAMADPDEIRNPLSSLNLNVPELKMIILGQQGTGRLVPKECEGWEIVANYFVNKPPVVLGIKLGSAPPGYSFAVYKRKESSSDQ
ncbi:MAG TPA: hypothetical protein VKX17_05965 [Planctomycetota bacterium]|nr:hypothetical protein [Planctomycetota bacterium]